MNGGGARATGVPVFIEEERGAARGLGTETAAGSLLLLGWSI